MGACVSSPPPLPSQVFVLQGFVPDAVTAALDQLDAQAERLNTLIYAQPNEGNVAFIIGELEAGRRVSFANVNALSALSFVKLYLERIPQPLLPVQQQWCLLRTFDNFNLVFVRAAGDVPADHFDRLLLVRAQLLLLPPCNQVLLRRLIALLARVCHASHTGSAPLTSPMPISLTALRVDGDAYTAATAHGNMDRDNDDDPDDGDGGRAANDTTSSPSTATAKSISMSFGSELGALDQITPQKVAREFAPLFFRLVADTVNSAMPIVRAAPRSCDTVVACEVVAYLIVNFIELFTINPYRLLVDACNTERRLREANSSLAVKVDQHQQRTTKLLDALHHQKHTVRAAARAFAAWRAHVVREKLKRHFEADGSVCTVDRETPRTGQSLLDLERAATPVCSAPQTPVRRALNTAAATHHVPHHARFPIASAFPHTTDPALFATALALVAARSKTSK